MEELTMTGGSMKMKPNSKIKVIIADDSLFMRQNLTNIMTKGGYEVIGEALDGLMAVEMYKNLKPQIMTMDITMPKLTGLDALKQIKQIDNTAKIIMCTSMSQKCFIKDAFDNGAIDYLVKPFKPQLVIDTLRRVSLL